MNKKFKIIGALATLVFLSSCNRGMGCPSDFSLGDWISSIVSILPF